MDWRKLEAAVDSKINASFGEEIRLSFIKNGNADPSRPMVTVRAVLHTGGDEDNGIANKFYTHLSAGQAELVLSRAEYAGPAPKQGDRVRANDRAGKPWWEVKSVSDRYSNLWVLLLNQI
ncbi:hypothetical protein [Pseudochelatococcus sp. G4_1912]|uniref:hypothetical protein n=1 Tax=Pseudochelatococcus sp. G4_1912 TaxID=3114288 RepID=UPI0039C61BC2